MTDLEVRAEVAAVTGFKWKTQRGQHLAPGQMETRHLFFTIRMIWNHVAPDEVQLKPFKRYRFGSFYTREYMARAVRELAQELSLREDIEDRWMSQLRHIQRHADRLQNPRLGAPL